VKAIEKAGAAHGAKAGQDVVEVFSFFIAIVSRRPFVLRRFSRF
jgi:hypothetical protein